MDSSWITRTYPTDCSYGLYSCRACTNANPTTALHFQIQVFASGMGKTHPGKVPLDCSPPDSRSDVDHPRFLLDLSDSQLQI